MQYKFFNNATKENKRERISQKLLVTLLSLLILRAGNLLPLPGFDLPALEQAFSSLNQNNYLVKIMNMYSSASTPFLTFFSLGIIPYINASIIIDLLTSLITPLEKMQEEGESGKKILNSYKKLLTCFIAAAQGTALLLYFKDYFYNFNSLSFAYCLCILISGAMLVLFITNKIDNKGIGNGTSIIIFSNIILALWKRGQNFLLLDSNEINEISLILAFLLFVVILQKGRISIPLVSARQLAFFQEEQEKNKQSNQENISKKSDENGLAIKYNQAGIFPIIIASNIIPFFSFLANTSFSNLSYLLYNFFIIAFNYFYTLIFWDPDKISKQLSKASVSIVDVRPGKETISYLQNIVKSSSLLGGLSLAFISIIYDFMVKSLQFNLLNQLNISSLIIIAGVAFDIQKYLYSLYQSLQDQPKKKYES